MSRRNPNEEEEELFADSSFFRFGSGSIIPPAARFSDTVGNNDHRSRAILAGNTFELQPPQEVRTLGRPYSSKAAKLIHHQIQV